MPVLAAVDVGASGGRVMAGIVEDGAVRLEAVHRFPNGIVERDGLLRWDLTHIYDEVRIGLARIPDPVSIGVDTWGVDYGLLDEAGELVGEPVAYRDDRTSRVIDAVHAVVSPEELFAINGLQHLPFNTVYQLAAERLGPCWDRVAQVVLLPDLLAYWLTGALRAEVTNASTTGLLDARTRAWSSTLLERLDLPLSILPDLEEPGSLRGHTAEGVPVTTVGSHDTASAVAAVPATSRRFAFVASGTWSLVGVELEAPVLTDAARTSRFTNEVGVEGRTRFLRNVGGFWLLQECLRSWGRDDTDDLVAQAALLAGGPQIDVDDAAFISPGGMPERIAAAAGHHLEPVEVVRCILDSLASGYARTIAQAEALSGCGVDVVHVVGGGSQNELLCQLLADAVGRPVVAGPVEATALGNIVVQARACGELAGSLDEIRAQLAATTMARTFDPR